MFSIIINNNIYADLNTSNVILQYIFFFGNNFVRFYLNTSNVILQ